VEIDKTKSIIEAILFSAGRIVETKELMAILELNNEDVDTIIQSMKSEFEEQNRGIEIIKVDNGYQLCSRKEYYDYIYPIFDNRAKPNLSAAALETLSIIAYNPKITRAEIEQIRGVNSDGTIYKLLANTLLIYIVLGITAYTISLACKASIIASTLLLSAQLEDKNPTNPSLEENIDLFNYICYNKKEV